jgi:heat-inducible transcriptional repressor
MKNESASKIDDSPLSQRACVILKLVVERYIEAGQPVGSRTLCETTGLDVSAATIRSTLSDLERLGYLSAPHTSAGRVPTPQGYRFFVDALLTPQTPQMGEHLALKHQLVTSLIAGEEAATSASELLSKLSQMAAVVSVPRQNHCRLQQIEFVMLTPRRVLAVLVVNGNKVQNRIFELPEPISAPRLAEAAGFLNEHYAGRDLVDLRELLSGQVQERWDHVDRVMRQVAQFAEQVVSSGGRNKLAVSGRGNLLSGNELLDPQYLRGLFDALDRKRDLLSVLDSCLDASGIRIFIGHEAGYNILDNCSLVTSPYHVDGELAGVLGVIGPQRMNYGRIIPLVNATARALGGALDDGLFNGSGSDA